MKYNFRRPDSKWSKAFDLEFEIAACLTIRTLSNTFAFFILIVLSALNCTNSPLFLSDIIIAQAKWPTRTGRAGGKTWTCKPVRSCPKAIQDLRKNKRPQQCRFSSSQPVVCCEPLDSPKPPPSPKPPRFPSSSKPGSKSKQKCKEYAEYVYVKTQGFFGNEVKYDTCAIVEPLITKGKDAQSREYPHMVVMAVVDTCWRNVGLTCL
ncbi:serine-type endopeptidase activity protein [Homalodisca vitripennis]|nr:serine-type endopeptidase activity protein [Homalodisca vitripennis]